MSASDNNPARIGGYEILGELGRGAMGVVYHARDAAIGRPVAIKVIRIDAGTSAEESAQLRQRLIREASVAGKIYHPGIVTVHQLGEEGSNVFIVMEFVEGSSLEHLLTHNPKLDRDWALDILAQVAVAERGPVLPLCKLINVQCECLLHLSLRLTNPLIYILKCRLTYFDQTCVSSGWIVRSPGVDAQPCPGFWCKDFIDRLTHRSRRSAPSGGPSTR